MYLTTRCGPDGHTNCTDHPTGILMAVALSIDILSTIHGLGTFVRDSNCNKSIGILAALMGKETQTGKPLFCKHLQ